jgi:outer membrane protein assembly factor BamB
LALTLALPGLAADWPQFLGPRRDSTTPEKVSAWDAPPPVLWKQPVGPGHSSPVVAGETVNLFFQPPGKDADALAAYDAKTGAKKWEKSYARAHFDPPFGAGPRGTPTVDGGQVFTLGGTGILACWDAKSGELVWKADTLKQFHAENLTFGVSESPLVFAGKVFVNVGGKGAGVVAFDRKTGQPAWQATDDGMSYSSPVAVGKGDAAQVVFLTRDNLLGLSPATGAVFWKVPFRDLLSESASAPLAVGDLLIGSSVSLGSIALKRTTKDGKPAVEQLWRKRELNCYFSTPVAVGTDHLYMLNGILSITPSITLRCVEAKTGKVLWSKPKVGKYHAALLRMGDGNLLMHDDTTGDLRLLAADPKEYRELARSKACGPTWAHPAVAGGMVFVRDNKELVALSLGGQ